MSNDEAKNENNNGEEKKIDKNLGRRESSSHNKMAKTKITNVMLPSGKKTSFILRKDMKFQDILEKSCYKAKLDKDKYCLCDENDNELDLNVDAFLNDYQLFVKELDVVKNKTENGNKSVEENKIRSSTSSIEISSTNEEESIQQEENQEANQEENPEEKPEELESKQERPKGVPLTEERKIELNEIFNQKENLKIIVYMQSCRRTKKSKKTYQNLCNKFLFFSFSFNKIKKFAFFSINLKIKLEIFLCRENFFHFAYNFFLI